MPIEGYSKGYSTQALTVICRYVCVVVYFQDIFHVFVSVCVCIYIYIYSAVPTSGAVSPSVLSACLLEATVTNGAEEERRMSDRWSLLNTTSHQRLHFTAPVI